MVRIIVLFTQKFVIKLSKIWTWDPGSEIRKNPSPDSGSRIKKAPDPGSVSATLLYSQIDGGKKDQRKTRWGWRVWQFNYNVENIKPFHWSPSSPSFRAVYQPPVWRRRVRASWNAPPSRSQPRPAHTP